MARQLFGTDGIRGVAGEYPLDSKTVTAIGSALGKWIAQSGREQQVVIGMDTRESGPALASGSVSTSVPRRPSLAGAPRPPP